MAVTVEREAVETEIDPGEPTNQTETSQVAEEMPEESSETVEDPAEIEVEESDDGIESIEEQIDESGPDEPDQGDESEEDLIEEAEASESEDAPEESVVGAEPVTVITGIGPAYSQRLEEAGVTTVGELAKGDAASLADKTELGESRLQSWIDAAKELGSPE